MLSKVKSYLKRVQNFFQPANEIKEELRKNPYVESVRVEKGGFFDRVIVKYKSDIDKSNKE
jgi:cell division septal protein FtsQ